MLDRPALILTTRFPFDQLPPDLNGRSREELWLSLGVLAFGLRSDPAGT